MSPPNDSLSPPDDTAMSLPLMTQVSPNTPYTHQDTTHTDARDDSNSISTEDEFDQQFAKREPIDRGRKFSMFAEWQPDQTFTDQAFTLGIDLGSLDQEQGERIEQALEEFRTYWMESHPGAAFTQRLWQQKFIQTSLKREFNNYNRGSSYGNSHSQNAGHRKQSPITQPFTADHFDLDASW